MNLPHRLSARLRGVFVLLAYAGLSLVLMWPLPRVWRTAVVGGPNLLYDDIAINVWNVWWTRWALDHSHTPFWTPLLYYPEGVQLYVQTLNLASSMLVLPMAYLAGPLGAYNLALGLTLLLTGFAAYLLVREFVTDRLIAGLCGGLLVAAPYMTLRIDNGNLNLISIQWLILYVLALARLERAGGWWSITMVVTTFALVVLTDWYWVLVAAVTTVIWCLLHLVRSADRWILGRRYILSGGILLVVMAPLLLGLWNSRAQLPGQPIRSGRPTSRAFPLTPSGWDFRRSIKSGGARWRPLW